jgi:predicted RNA-binding protein with PIN domain
MNATSYQSLLLIDGYNIIGAWPWLQQIKEKNGLELARNALIETLVNYIGYKGLEAKVVFDAHYRNTPSSAEKYAARLWVHYTAFAETADTYIEKYCASHTKRKLSSRSRLIVATSDQAQRHTVVGYGAEWMSAQILAKEVETTKKRGKRNFRSRDKKQGRFLLNSLDPKTQQIFAQWRQGDYSTF